jgi:hypothetical protein
MEKNPQENLEALIHRELSKLPPREAPEMLVPRVLARIQAQHCRSWWQRPWSQWPLGLQVAAVPLMLAMVMGVLWSISALWNSLVAKVDVEGITSDLGPLEPLWDVLCALGNAAMVVLRSGSQEWLLLALFVPLSMYLACVGLGTLAYRTMAAKAR